VSTLAQSDLHASSHSAGGAAELATSRKETKYASLSQSFLFQPVAVETLGSTAPFLVRFLVFGGPATESGNGDVREMAYLFQQLSVAIQRYNCPCK